MADGQAAQAPEASVESRLEAYFSPPKPEVPAEESQEVGGTVDNQAGECDCVVMSNPGQPRERTYEYDPNRNLTKITGTTTPWYNQTFEYDELNRLTSATGRYGSISYTYDVVGNRLTRNTNGTVETYTYFTGTNRLQQIREERALGRSATIITGTSWAMALSHSSTTRKTSSSK